MKNNTKSYIIIEMKHIDHANKLIKFLKKLEHLTGGDLSLIIHSDDKTENCFIGHDVNVLKVIHIKNEISEGYILKDKIFKHFAYKYNLMLSDLEIFEILELLKTKGKLNEE